MEPKLLLMDEPFGGLNMKEIKELSERIITLKDQGITIVIIDHHFSSVLEISDEVAVLHHGKIIAEGPPEKIIKDRRVTSAYLSGEGHFGSFS